MNVNSIYINESLIRMERRLLHVTNRTKERSLLINIYQNSCTLSKNIVYDRYKGNEIPLQVLLSTLIFVLSCLPILLARNVGIMIIKKKV